MARLFFDHALLDRGWAENVRIDIDAAGWIEDLVSGAPAEAPDFHGAIAGDNRVVTDVWVGGRQVVAAGRHQARQAAASTYRDTLTALLNW